MENDRDYGESDPDVGDGEPVLRRTVVKIVLFLLSCAVTMIIIVIIINGNMAVDINFYCCLMIIIS